MSHATNVNPPPAAAARRVRRGFSLIEFTAVLALMALVAGVVTLNVRYFVNKGKDDAVRVEIATIENALEAFYNVEGRYPTNEEGLAVLAEPRGVGGESLLARVPRDPWRNPYQYVRPGLYGPYDVICLGADGREGGDGLDADMASYDLDAADGGA